MKKGICVLLSLCLACGTAAFAESKKNVQFTWMHHLQEKGKQAWVKALVDDYEKEHPNVKINIELLPSDQYNTMLKTRIAAGDAPMIFDLGNQLFQEFVNAGYCADVTNMKGMENYDQATIDQSKVGNKIYGVCIDKNAYCVFYNKDIFKKYGLSVPKTNAELMKVCQVLQSHGIVPMAAPFAELWCLRYYDMVLTDVQCCRDNANWFADKMSQKVPFSSDQAFKDCANIFYGYKPYWGKDPFGTKWNDAMNAVAAGKAAMTLNGSWAIDGIMAINPQINLGAFALPTSNSASGAVMVVKPGSSYCVYNNTKQPEVMAAAMDFFRYMSSKKSAEYFAKYAHGLTGCKIDSKVDITALNDINSYKGKNLYVQSNLVVFTPEYQNALFETLTAYAMKDSFDVNAFCKELDATYKQIKNK